MAVVTNRGPGQWQVKVRKKGFPTESRTFTLKADAERWGRQVEAEMERGLYLPRKTAETTTLEAVADEFAASFAPNHYRGTAWKFKLARLREKLGKYALAALSPALVAAYRDDRLAEPDSRFKHDLENAPRVSPSTVKGELDLLSKVVGFAQKELGIHLPHGNPVLGIRKPQAAGGRERRLTEEERIRLLEECCASKNRWLHPAVELALETAMRQGEILSLRWEHIDLKAGVALIPMSKNGDTRAVPLTNEALATLGALPRAISGEVFPIGRMTLYKAFGRAVDRAGIKDLTFHDLRHEALSTLAEIGDLNVLELASVSGHKTLQVLKRYTHLQAGKLAEKINAAKQRKAAGS